jgi:malonyl CoA-acyl carrier protein transacylase
VPDFQTAVGQVELKPARVTVFSAVTAQPFADAADMRHRLVEGLTKPVRWRETMLALHGLGADRFVEVGPGRVLSNLIKRTLQDVELVHAGAG